MLLVWHRDQRGLARDLRTSRERSRGHHRLNLQSGRLQRMHPNLHLGREVGKTVMHVDRNGIYRESRTIAKVWEKQGVRRLTVFALADRGSDPPDHVVLRCADYGCAIHYGDWHWYRDIDGPDVSKRALRCRQTWTNRIV